MKLNSEKINFFFFFFEIDNNLYPNYDLSYCQIMMYPEIKYRKKRTLEDGTRGGALCVCTKFPLYSFSIKMKIQNMCFSFFVFRSNF